MYEYIHTSRYPHSLRVAFQADPTANYLSRIPEIINEDNKRESTISLDVIVSTIRNLDVIGRLRDKKPRSLTQF